MEVWCGKKVVVNYSKGRLTTSNNVLVGKPLIYTLGDFADEYMQKRVATNIHLKSLRLKTNVDQQEHKNFKTLNKEVRIVKGVELPFSIVLWDNTAALVTQKKSC